MRRYVYSKWAKTKALMERGDIRPYVPDTRRLTMSSFHAMLDRYQMIYLKPVLGSFGNGVMRVEKIAGEEDGEPTYRYQLGLQTRQFNSIEELYRAIVRKTANKPYLAQKGIHLTRYKQRPFDIRVMVQLNPQRKWETTGLIGRVAHPRKIVTNYHNGGTPLPLDTLLAGYPVPGSRKQYVRLLAELGVKVARQLQRKYPGIREIGIDVALDDQLKPWILEVNTCPDPYIFRKLPDKRVFRKVYRYNRANER